MADENTALQRLLEEAQAAKKVPLPWEVAKALEKAQEKYNSFGIMRAVFEKRDGYGLADVYVWLSCAGPVRELERIEVLMSALVNGYTIEEPQTFQTNRKLDHSEIRAIRRWYEGALLREKDGTDPDGFAKEAIEEVALYLGGAELLKDISGFCKTHLEREQAAQSG
jgi:hypothetical protein